MRAPFVSSVFVVSFPKLHFPFLYLKRSHKP